ncbi:hypothetical protein M427DRAFT_55748 [Gonapodya prolifera JEL478]|uniref:Uncharacterized protein n=1 Tax=Gonapodya prolifera (strain JEL478) TaxID=1344416 RepID=A0A139AHM0_GONPJ|nr:hypothetical protein M427DRAFT_55748 [Gonapodya prolifera JEL478]|eukprot:KXS16321.1 hypothetical protein M427DRAFT_55748 [Gonapodya prolifera JEL478]
MREPRRQGHATQHEHILLSLAVLLPASSIFLFLFPSPLSRIPTSTPHTSPLTSPHTSQFHS